MAVTSAGTVFVVAADNDTIKGPVSVCGMKYIAGSGSPAIQVRSGGASGVILWEADGATDVFDNVEFRTQDDLYIDLAGTGTLLYVYTKV